MRFVVWKTNFYLTIRLRARDFYAVIVDEGEARINYHRIEIESEFEKSVQMRDRGGYSQSVPVPVKSSVSYLNYYVQHTYFVTGVLKLRELMPYIQES